MPQIDYFYAAISPFCYLAGNRLEEIAAQHGATIRYVPINAPALFPRTGGQVLAERHDSRKTYRLQELRRTAAKQGVKLVQAFPRAVWAEGRNIAEDDVVRDILTAHGFDPAIANKHMLMAAETYMANLEEAVARGVFGVPFYIVGDERFWGQDRLEDLDLHLAGKL
jgi:2-hydroxychromene-2-carboxylate isomerase